MNFSHSWMNLIFLFIANLFGAFALTPVAPTEEELERYPEEGLPVRFFLEENDIHRMESIPNVELDVQLQHARNTRFLARKRYTLNQLTDAQDENGLIECRFPTISKDFGGPVVLSFYLDSDRNVQKSNMFGEYEARRRSLLAVSEPFSLPGLSAAIGNMVTIPIHRSIEPVEGKSSGSHFEHGRHWTKKPAIEIRIPQRTDFANMGRSQSFSTLRQGWLDNGNGVEHISPAAGTTLNTLGPHVVVEWNLPDDAVIPGMPKGDWNQQMLVVLRQHKSSDCYSETVIGWRLVNADSKIAAIPIPDVAEHAGGSFFVEYKYAIPHIEKAFFIADLDSSPVFSARGDRSCLDQLRAPPLPLKLEYIPQKSQVIEKLGKSIKNFEALPVPFTVVRDRINVWVKFSANTDPTVARRRSIVVDLFLFDPILALFKRVESFRKKFLDVKKDSIHGRSVFQFNVTIAGIYSYRVSKLDKFRKKEVSKTLYETGPIKLISGF